MANCITDAAYAAAATKQASAIKIKGTAEIAIQVGVALWQRNASQSISNMQTQLADEQVKLAEAVHAHAIKFWPAEAALVTDVFNEVKITAPYAALGLAWGGLVTDTMAQARLVWIDDARRNCNNPTRCDDARWQRNTAGARVDLASYGYRQAEAREQITNDRRYARQLAVLGLGRGGLGNLLSYQSVSQSSGLGASGILEGTINSAMQAYGYYSARAGRPEPWGASIRDSWSSARMPSTVSVDRPYTATTVGIADAARAPTEALAPVARTPRPGKEGESDTYSGLW